MRDLAAARQVVLKHGSRDKVMLFTIRRNEARHGKVHGHMIRKHPARCLAPRASVVTAVPASGSISLPGVGRQDKSICVIGEFADKLSDVIRVCGYTTEVCRLVRSHDLKARDPASTATMLSDAKFDLIMVNIPHLREEHSYSKPGALILSVRSNNLYYSMANCIGIAAYDIAHCML